MVDGYWLLVVGCSLSFLLSSLSSLSWLWLWLWLVVVVAAVSTLVAIIARFIACTCVATSFITRQSVPCEAKKAESSIQRAAQSRRSKGHLCKKCRPNRCHQSWPVHWDMSVWGHPTCACVLGKNEMAWRYAKPRYYLFAIIGVNLLYLIFRVFLAWDSMGKWNLLLGLAQWSKCFKLCSWNL